jgi:hypothetical protein
MAKRDGGLPHQGGLCVVALGAAACLANEEWANPLPIRGFRARPRSSKMGRHSIGFISLHIAT